jgi:lysophospholipase L1-like esterase
MPRERRSKYANDAKDTVGIASQVESLSSSLAQKATKEEVRLKAVKLAMEDMSDTVISAISGGTTVNVLSIPQNESVTLEKLDTESFDLSVTDTKTLTNLITNGNFSAVWASSNAVHTVSNNIGSFTATVTGGRINSTLNTITGNKYYIRAVIKANSPSVGMNFSGVAPIAHSGNGQFEVVSGINTALVTGATSLRIHDDRASGWTEVQVKEVLVIDLTATYGAGNEPTKTDFDNILTGVNSGNWFSGSVVQKLPLANDEVLFYNGVTIKSKLISEYTKPLSGKKVVCFGDSVTEFGNYPEFAGIKTGAEVINVGFGGARMSNHPTLGYKAFCMTKLADAIASGDFSQQIAEQNVPANSDDNTQVVSRLTAIDWNTVDIITINYGTNDYRSAIPVGDFNSPMNDTTFSGAIAYVINKISTKYPHIQIAFITPAWRWNDGLDCDTNPNASGVLLKAYIEAEIAMVQKYKLPVLDMYRTSGINQYTATLYIAPGEDVHLSAKGYEHFGNKVGAFLQSHF